MILFHVMFTVLSNTMYGNFQLKFGVTVLLFKLNEENCYGTTVYQFWQVSLANGHNIEVSIVHINIFSYLEYSVIFPHPCLVCLSVCLTNHVYWQPILCHIIIAACWTDIATYSTLPLGYKIVSSQNSMPRATPFMSNVHHNMGNN